MTASRATDAVCVGDHNRTFEETRLFNPGGTGHLTVAVLRKPAGKYGIVHGIFSARKNGGNSGANRTFSDLQLPFSGDERGVTDKDAVDVGDGVEFSGSAIKRNAEIAGAGLFGSVPLREGGERECEPERKEQERKVGTNAHCDWFSPSMKYELQKIGMEPV
jgi:hypothetical protein